MDFLIRIHRCVSSHPAPPGNVGEELTLEQILETVQQLEDADRQVL